MSTLKQREYARKRRIKNKLKRPNMHIKKEAKNGKVS